MDSGTRRPASVAAILLLAIVLGFVGGLLGGFLTSNMRGREGNIPAFSFSRPPSAPPIVSRAGAPGSFADVAAAVIPTVVNIDTVSEGANAEERELFRRLLPFPVPVPKEREGVGSGVIIRSDGLILTNEHVVNDAKRIRVTLSDGRTFSGRLLGKDAELDAAVIKVDASGLPAARLGDSARLRPGDWALAVGSPLGLSSSVALGVVSALNRPIQVSDRPYRNLIQTDASISPGNSGGPLVDANGEVVGINTAIQIDMGRPVVGAAATRIGFAVPINDIKDIVEELIRTGKVVRPWVGIAMKMIAEEDIKRWELPQKEGIIIGSVMQGSPAEKAGLFPHDIIVTVDGKPVKKMEGVQKLVRTHKVGDTVVFEVKRESAGGFWRTHQVKVKTTEMPQGPIEFPQPEGQPQQPEEP